MDLDFLNAYDFDNLLDDVLNGKIVIINSKCDLKYSISLTHNTIDKLISNSDDLIRHLMFNDSHDKILMANLIAINYGGIYHVVKSRYSPKDILVSIDGLKRIIKREWE